MFIVDRRLNPRGKSLANRQRFLRRAKALVQRAVKEASKHRDIRDVLSGGEVGIAVDGMEEPRFRRGPEGVHHHVLPGNKEFLEGDVIPRSGAAEGRPKNAGEGDAQDAFRFLLTRDEFLDLFLDDLELPDLAKRRLTEVEHENPSRAGYSISGSPENIALNVTMRRAMMRRIALRRPRPDLIAQLDAELSNCEDEETCLRLQTELDALKARLRRIPYIDPVDLRYRRFENEPKPVAQAVMFCLMDVSGSMSEHMKDLAKRFYMLLYVFLTKRYRRVDIVFIHHTDHAEEVDEETFFHSQETGGTLVSSGLEEVRRIIVARYRPDDWNIYVAQASDGDNAYSDSAATERLLKGAILPVCQHFAYIEVGEPGSAYASNSPLWSLYQRLRSENPVLSMRKVKRRTEIFPVFHDLFQRRSGAERVSS